MKINSSVDMLFQTKVQKVKDAEEMEMAAHTMCLCVFVSIKGNMFSEEYDCLTKIDKLG